MFLARDVVRMGLFPLLILVLSVDILRLYNSSVVVGSWVQLLGIASLDICIPNFKTRFQIVKSVRFGENITATILRCIHQVQFTCDYPGWFSLERKSCKLFLSFLLFCSCDQSHLFSTTKVHSTPQTSSTWEIKKSTFYFILYLNIKQALIMPLLAVLQLPSTY